ncbi:hypothetical protein RhiJN_25811 [Ceratobasidium sp. AG-Ba]|nr:hypothetical protein RhiJN_25811 [Ceratobasidium sp. AG-Ba]
MSNEVGHSLENPANESFLFQAEQDSRYSQRSAPAVPRVLDSFFFVVKGKMAALPLDWSNNQPWEGVHVVGAVASLAGKLRNDMRFRNGLGHYAMLSPHKGYSNDWTASISRVSGAETVPRIRRCIMNGPPPSWWDQELWLKFTGKEAIRQSVAGKSSEHVPHPILPRRRPPFVPKGPPSSLLLLAQAAWHATNDLAPDSRKSPGQQPAEVDGEKEPQAKRSRKA